MLWGEAAQPGRLPGRDRGLDGSGVAGPGDDHVVARRDAGRKVAGPFTLVVADGLVAVEIQPVGQVALYVEDGNRHVFLHAALDAELAQLLAQLEVNGARGSRDVQNQAVDGVRVAFRNGRKTQQEHHTHDERNPRNE